MGGRGEADDEEIAPMVAKVRNRLAPISVVAKRGALLMSDPLPPLHEPGTESAGDKSLVQLVDLIHSVPRV
jgi:hypothetical protein